VIFLISQLHKTILREKKRKDKDEAQPMVCGDEETKKKKKHNLKSRLPGFFRAT